MPLFWNLINLPNTRKPILWIFSTIQIHHHSKTLILRYNSSSMNAYFGIVFA